MRSFLPLAALITAALVAPVLATADPAEPAGLLWKHRHDGTTEGWTAHGAARLTASPGGEGLQHVSTHAADVSRSPSFPEGAIEVVLSAFRSSITGSITIAARDASGADLLVVKTNATGRPCVGSACDAYPLGIFAGHLTIRIAPDGWSVANEKRVFASGPEALGALDHVALGKGALFMRDVRVYGAQGGIDEPLRASLGAFEGRVDIGLFGEEAARVGHSRGAVIDAREWETRTLLVAPAPDGRWYFQQNVLVYQGPDTRGYAIVAGLDDEGDTLWRVGLGHTSDPLAPDMWRLTLVEGSRVETFAEVGQWDGSWSAYQWNRRVAALADPATGILTLRVDRDVVGTLHVPSLARTAYVAFGDADVVPVLVDGTLQTGGGASHHEDAVIARVGPAFEV